MRAVCTWLMCRLLLGARGADIVGCPRGARVTVLVIACGSACVRACVRRRLLTLRSLFLSSNPLQWFIPQIPKFYQIPGSGRRLLFLTPLFFSSL